MKKIISSWIGIFVGCTILAAGFVYFINPYNLVPGGVYGASIVLHNLFPSIQAVSYTHLRAHETCADLVCRLLLEKKKPAVTDTFNECFVPY